MFLINFLKEANKNRFNVQDRADVLYDHINWKNSVIGGSYALKQFYGNKDVDWTPEDIDIMVGVKSEKEFIDESTRFEKNTSSVLVKYSRKITNDMVEITNVQTGEKEIKSLLDSNNDSEVYHEYINGSRTYTNPTAGKVQLVHVQTSDDRDVKSILSEVTDIPCCVSFHVEK